MIERNLYASVWKNMDSEIVIRRDEVCYFHKYDIGIDSLSVEI